MQTMTFGNINQFYRHISKISGIVMHSKHLTNFRDVMFLYINGCECDRKRNLKTATQLYLNMSQVDRKTIDMFLDNSNSDEVIFRQSGKEFLRWKR